MVITSFLQTAANPAFRSSLLHSLLYRKHILEEENVPGLPTQSPPYFSQEMFSLIKKVHKDLSLNIITMTEKDWSRLLTEQYITMEYNMENEMEMRKCKAELDSPNTDWPISWSLCRQPGLHPELASFMWKLMLNLLPTQERLHRMRISEAAECKQCSTESGTLQHELMDCEFNQGVGHLLLSCLQEHLPVITASQLLRLELGNLPDDKKLPCTILIATTLKYLWMRRTSLSRVRAYQVRAELEQTINLLRTSRLSTVAAQINSLKDKMFQ